MHNSRVKNVSNTIREYLPSVICWAAIFLSTGIISPVIYYWLSAQMPADGSGFVFHYQTLLSVIVAVSALALPYMERMLDRRRSIKLVRLKSAHIAETLLRIMTTCWPNSDTLYSDGTIFMRGAWISLRSSIQSEIISTQDAVDLSPMEIEFVIALREDLAKIDHMAETLPINEPIPEHSYGSAITSFIERAIRHSSFLSGDHEIINLANNVVSDHQLRYSAHITARTFNKK